MKKATKVTLLFVVFFNIMGLMIGCTRHSQPKAYVCVEKPPVKITYIDFHKDITPTTVDMMIRHARFFPYKEMQLNSSNQVIIDYTANTSEHKSDANSFEVKK